MYGVLCAELIKSAGAYPSRPDPWVARITGTDPKWGFQRSFIRGVRDYTHARSKHRITRGTYMYFALAPGLYEYFRPVSWKHDQRGFIRVDENGDDHEISREEVLRWCLNAELESTS